MARREIEDRVRRVAEQTLAEQHYARPADVLLGRPPELVVVREKR